MVKKKESNGKCLPFISLFTMVNNYNIVYILWRNLLLLDKIYSNIHG